MQSRSISAIPRTANPGRLAISLERLPPVTSRSAVPAPALPSRKGKNRYEGEISLIIRAVRSPYEARLYRLAQACL